MKLFRMLFVTGIVASCGIAAMPSRTASAMTQFTVVPAASPSPLAKGKADMHRGDYKDAEAQFKLAVKQNPKSLDAYEQLAFAALDYRDFPTSYGAFKEAVAFKPHDKRLLYYAGASGLYAAEFAQARGYIDTLISLYPKYAAAYHVRFLIDTSMLDRKNQLKDAKAVLKLRPHDANSLNDMGMALANNSKEKQAYAEFSRAIAAQPGNYQYYENRALVDHLQKNYAREISDLNHALADTKDPAVRKQLQSRLKVAQKVAKSSKK